jgi:hypothetical protein
MSLLHRAQKRSIATGSVLGLAAATAAVIGTATPASAAPISFDCVTPIGSQAFPVDVSTNAPSTVPTGSTIKPTVTAVMTIPATFADLIRGVLGLEEGGGQIVSHVLVNGTDVPTTLTIPRSSLGPSGDAVLTATGVMPAITGGTPGDTIDPTAGPQDVAMTLFDLGAPTGTLFTIPCTPAAGQNTAVDSVSVVKAGSLTKVAASYSAKRDVATGKATVAATNGIATTGKVKFVLKRGAKKVATMTKALKGGKATAQFKRVRKSGKYTLIAQYLGSSRVKGSTGKDTFSVR